MEISLSELFPGIKLGQFHATTSVRAEIKELVDEQLIGESSHGMGLMSEDTLNQAPLYQWSEQTNNQWWALMGEGEFGEQAAGFLEQMVIERRELASSYVSGYFTLASQLAENLKDDAAPSASVDQLLDNVSAGRTPWTNADGSTLPKAQQIEAFWSTHQTQISQTQADYQRLEEFPDSLENWFDARQIERPAIVDQLIDKHRYSGLNGDKPTSEALHEGSMYVVHSDGRRESISASAPDAAHQRSDFLIFSYITSQQESYAHQAQSMATALRLGDAGMLKHAMAEPLMHAERKQHLKEYQQLYMPVANAFNQVLGKAGLGFTLQDVLDNLSAENADRSPSVLANGEQHPQAQSIQAFATQHQQALQTLVEKQEMLEQLPRDKSEWLKIPENTKVAEQAVYDSYGLEPWETGANARQLRAQIWEMLNHSEFFVEGQREQMIAQFRKNAMHVGSSLTQLINQDSEDFSLHQLLENFRFNRPLGLMENGQLHPQSEAFEQFVRQNREDFITYIDTQWLLNEDSSQPTYAQDLTYEQAGSYADALLQQIIQSHQVLTDQQLFGEQLGWLTSQDTDRV